MFEVAKKNELEAVNICGFYIKDVKSHKIIREFNQKLDIKDSENSFWKSFEIESKINLYADGIPFISNLSQMKGNKFIFSKPALDTTYEKYFTVEIDGDKYSAVRLGKRNWRKKMALKKKIEIGKNGNTISRKMIIEEWNPDLSERQNLINSFGTSSLKYTPHRTFYKKKARIVCVNSETGTVFGISSDICSPIHLSDRLMQIEIEYWSQLVHEDEKINIKQIEKIRDDDMRDLNELIIGSLIKGDIPYNIYIVESKYEWISKIS